MLLPSMPFLPPLVGQSLLKLISLVPHFQAPGVVPIIVAILGAICLLVYITTWVSFMTQRKCQGPGKIPPTVPYLIPFVGSALSFALNPRRCISASSQLAGKNSIHGLKILNKTLYFLYKPENVAKIRKYRATITTPGVTTFVLKTLFGMDPKAFNMYTVDSSGIHSRPKEGSQVAPHNRIDYLTHNSFHKHLLGEGLLGTYQNFSIAFLGRLQSLNIHDEWIEFPDIMNFWLESLTASMNEAIAGTTLEYVNPNFTKDLLKYFPYIQDLMKGLPRWCIPEAYRLREGLIRDVKQWHAIARARFQEADVTVDGGADPWWGSAFMRERQRLLVKVDNWDYDAIASSDFGILWGASVNIHPMAIWNIVEIFRDPLLLCRVRAELKDADLQGITSSEDIDKLLSLPLLQSIYAELLRLRVEVQTVFSSDQEDIFINEWRFPKNSLLIVPAGPAHRDPDFWNTKDGKHPVDRFWADRFLAYPQDPKSGPRKEDVAGTGNSTGDTAKDPIGSSKAKFVSSGLADSFVPWGIGERTCPGRGFARREIVAVVAIIVEKFDIEILTTQSDFELNPAFYGIGTQRPLRAIPFKARKRNLQ